MKKITQLCFLGLFVLWLGFMPVEAKSQSIYVTHINPLYQNVITEEELIQHEHREKNASISGIPKFYESTKDTGKTLRTGLVNRKEVIEVGYKTGKELGQQDILFAIDEIFGKAIEHTGKPNEGDYLKWQYKAYGCEVGWYSDEDGTTYYDMIYYMDYYTTLTQEKAVDKKVKQVLSSLALNRKTDYQKVRAIYDYICRTVSYDYNNLEKRSYTLKYSAYAALIKKTAVCQGYALLLYRMLEEVNIDNRIITSTEHAWNIVRLNGRYYNVDSTWDAPQYGDTYLYFLKSNQSFQEDINHEREEEYTTDVFNKKYVMCEEDYPVPLNAPLLRSTVNVVNGVEVRWNAVEGAERYRIYRKTGSTGQWSVIGNTTSDTSYIDTSAKNNTTYYYSVACAEKDSENFSDYNAKGMSIKFLSAPVISSVTNASSGMTVKWNKVSGAQKYRIYRKAGSSPYKKVADTTATSYTDKKTGNGAKYTYAVRCITSAGYEASGMRNDGTSAVRLSSPVVLSVSNVSGRKIILKWKKVTFLDEYEIEYATSKTLTSGKKSIKITEKNATTGTISNLLKNKTYYIRVRGYKTIAGVKYSSGWSNIKKVKIKK